MKPDRLLVVAGIAFAALYYPTVHASAALGDALLLLPPVAFAVLFLVRGRREEGRVRFFFWLLSLGLWLWAAGEGLWLALRLRGQDPNALSGHPGLQGTLDFLFIGFLVPILGAAAFQPHPRISRRDGVAFADAFLMVVAILFVFMRIVFLPLVDAPSELNAPRFALGMLSCLLAVLATLVWRRVDDPQWENIYGSLTLFAVLYGVLGTLANGFNQTMPSPGGVLDTAWFMPFFILARAGFRTRRAPGHHVLPGWSLVLLVGTGPLLVDLGLDVLLPAAAARAHGEHVTLLLVTSALLALGCAFRLSLAEGLEARVLAEARGQAAERRRADRLRALAALSQSVIEELVAHVGTVAERAADAVAALGSEAGRVLGQAERAQGIVHDLSDALRMHHTAPRYPVDVGVLLEEAVETGLSGGLPIRVRLDGISGLPLVLGEREALRSAILQLLRNAAQASPGGILKIRASRRSGGITLRFEDDGPGVPPPIRDKIFDPFFSTRAVGRGVGLGLTLVHFVMQDHGGSIVLEEEEEGGGRFVLYLPACEEAGAGRWLDPWPVAALVASALATSLAVMPVGGRVVLRTLMQLAGGIFATSALAAVAVLRRGRERTFWALLGAGVVLGCLGAVPPAHAGLWESALRSGGDLLWALALLLRPDRRRPEKAPLTAWLGGVAVLGLVVYFSLSLVVLPFPYAILAHSERGVILGSALIGAALAAWAGGLALGRNAGEWESVFGWLAGGIGFWTLGRAGAEWASTSPRYQPGALSDLGWTLPLLLLGAIGLQEALRQGPRRRTLAFESPAPLWTAVSLATLGALPAFNAALGSAPAGLAVARGRLTEASVLIVGLALACRQVLSQREVRAARSLLEGTRSRLASAERRSRLMGVVGSAVQELGGHLSAIRALSRLLLSHSDLSIRARGDAARVQAKIETASRILGNLLELTDRVSESLPLLDVNRVVEDVVASRRADCAAEGVVLSGSPAQDLPAVRLDAPALQQAVMGLIDFAAAAIRGAGRDGIVEVVTEYRGDTVSVAVRDNGPGLSEDALRNVRRPRVSGEFAGIASGLRVAREVAAQHGGLFVAGNRDRGGAFFEILLPAGERLERGQAG
ncbi:MAG TPA: HAMP domain-containing sensor histidine kinase [Vicinamibacteria bacterium]|nr:HAMP domain-containing sensor histidine kinase [Vicinamibacteria bacterium]